MDTRGVTEYRKWMDTGYKKQVHTSMGSGWMPGTGRQQVQEVDGYWIQEVGEHQFRACLVP